MFDKEKQDKLSLIQMILTQPPWGVGQTDYQLLKDEVWTNKRPFYEVRFAKDVDTRTKTAMLHLMAMAPTMAQLLATMSGDILLDHERRIKTGAELAHQMFDQMFEEMAEDIAARKNQEKNK